MKNYLDLMESFKTYVNLHEDQTANLKSISPHLTGRTSGQIYSDLVGEKEKDDSLAQQFGLQTMEILTNKRHSFKIEIRRLENKEAVVNTIWSFKEAFDRFLSDSEIFEKPSRDKNGKNDSVLRDSSQPKRSKSSLQGIKVGFHPDIGNPKERLGRPQVLNTETKRTSETFTLISSPKVRTNVKMAPLDSQKSGPYSPVLARHIQGGESAPDRNFEDTFRLKDIHKKNVNIDYINNYLKL
jgi:hypothetical protein